MEIEKNKQAVAEIIAREITRMKVDWRERYVVYPFLPHQDMAAYM